MNNNLKIGIIGLGLIGGSIFKALSTLKYDVFGVSKSPDTIEKAKKYCENSSLRVSTSLEILKECDIIFVCTAMNKTEQILDSLEDIISTDTIVLDVASLKRFLKPRPYKFIPSHPMAGTELSGFDNSFDTLFDGAKWVLTPFETTQEADLKTVIRLIENLGAEPVITTSKEHDEAVALISHMPMLIAQALFKTAQGNDLALKLASSGFRDMTRLALSNEELASDMVELNSDNIQSSILKLYSSVGELINKDYKIQISEIKSQRQSMYKDGKNVL